MERRRVVNEPRRMRENFNNIKNDRKVFLTSREQRGVHLKPRSTLDIVLYPSLYQEFNVRSCRRSRITAPWWNMQAHVSLQMAHQANSV
jgi:hypothetical protein